MSWQKLRPQIRDLIAGISGIAQAKKFPTFKFDQYPAASVFMSENQSDYETTSENLRVYAFSVFVYYPTKGLDGESIDVAISALEGLVDTIIDTIDQEDLKDSTERTVGVDLPANSQFINIFATPSLWGEVPGEELVFSEIIVRVRISKDVS